ncbi:MAG TPA: glycosyltransferase family 4 protein [Polyangiaceae bacterium]|nr:glycosyltransferase family 4 protein [Polyangiaceae bacterium]
MKVVLACSFPRDEKLGSARTPLRLEPELARLGVEVVSLFAEDLPAGPRGRAAELSAPFRMAWAVEQRAAGADIVDIAGGDGFAYFRYARVRRPRQALVARSNGLWDLALAGEDHGLKSPLKRAASRVYQEQVLCRWEQSAIRAADVAVFLSRCDADEVVRRRWKTRDGVGAVNPGVDAFFADDAPLEGRKDVAFVGTFFHRKGSDVASRVMSELMRERPELGLTLFGSGTSPEAARAHFDESVRSRVHVEPPLSARELAARLQHFAVFLFPTRYEGFGIVTTEAMARGLAVVTTPTGAGADIVRDGENGFIVPVGAVPEAKSAVARLLDDDALRVRLARAGRAAATALTWGRAAEQLVLLYERALSRRRH